MAVVEIETDDGVVGQGWCEDGVGAVSLVVDNHLSRLLIGSDASDVEGTVGPHVPCLAPLRAQRHRLTGHQRDRHCTLGQPGRALGKPVYELLGGPVHRSVQVYASALHPGRRRTGRPRSEGLRG